MPAHKATRYNSDLFGANGTASLLPGSINLELAKVPDFEMADSSLFCKRYKYNCCFTSCWREISKNVRSFEGTALIWLMNWLFLFTSSFLVICISFLILFR